MRQELPSQSDLILEGAFFNKGGSNIGVGGHKPPYPRNCMERKEKKEGKEEERSPLFCLGEYHCVIATPTCDGIAKRIHPCRLADHDNQACQCHPNAHHTSHLII